MKSKKSVRVMMTPTGVLVRLYDVATSIGFNDAEHLLRHISPAHVYYYTKDGAAAAPAQGYPAYATAAGLVEAAARTRQPRRDVLHQLAKLINDLALQGEFPQFLCYEKARGFYMPKASVVGGTPEVTPGVAPEVMTKPTLKAALDATVPRPAPLETAEQIGMYQEVALAHLETVPGCQAQVMPNKDVARAMGVKENDLRMHKMRHPELIQEGVHCVVLPVTASDGSTPRDTLCWSLAGVEVLADLIKGPRALEFRRLAKLARAQLSEAQVREMVTKELGGQIQQLMVAVADTSMKHARVAVNEAIQPLEARYNQQMQENQAVNNKSQALCDELKMFKDLSAAAKPVILDSLNIKTKRTIHRKDPMHGDRVPEFCQDWFSVTAIVGDPRFCLPFEMARVCAKNAAPDWKFMYRWLAKQGYIYRRPLLDFEAARVGENSIWAPNPHPAMVVNVTYWYQWDFVIRRVCRPAVGPVREVRKPNWRFSHGLTTTFAELWKKECDNGLLPEFASKIYPSWFKSGDARKYLAGYNIPFTDADLNRPDVPDDPSESGTEEENTPTK